jgi:AcrR family transcriptional regulator
MSSKAAAATSRASSSDTKDQIKAAAQRLFARHGVEGVTVLQIVSAAGQRNNAALHYHFGTKEELIRQLIVDGAAVLDARRQEMFREMAANDGLTTIRQVLEVLIMPVMELAADPRFRGYVRFTSTLQAADSDTLRAALNDRWNAEYVRCFDLLKKMLQLPAELVDQRLTLFAIFANATLSAREEALEKPKSKKSRLWDRDYTVDNILDVSEAMLVGQPSQLTSKFFGRRR